MKQTFGRKRKTEDKKLKFKGSECVFFTEGGILRMLYLHPGKIRSSENVSHIVIKKTVTRCLS